MTVKQYRVTGTVLHRFSAIIEVPDGEAIEDVLANDIEGGNFDQQDFSDYTVDDIEHVDTFQTLEDSQI